MKTRKMYEIRAWRGNEYSRSLSPKLRSRARAMKLVKYLRKHYGIEAFAAVYEIKVFK